ncbi:MAG: segregation/condensation protein A [Candidatus Marsarchaeota archaeon]|jgi:segregation and condensation protein A|nr:segregation/condensation protein A [Candidatus Marsarchaeota archaeon]
MATIQLEELKDSHQKIDIIDFVKDATWKDILMELVRKNKLDPWSIDIVEVIDKYLELVKTLKVMDLRVPANIILAAAILLRLKSEVVGITEEVIEQDEEPQVSRPAVQIEDLIPKLRPPMKRRISLNELIEAMDEAMKIRETRSNRQVNTISMPIPFTHRDIEEEIEKVYNVITKNADKKGMITFAQLIRTLNTTNVLLELFIPVLFLASKQRLQLLQSAFFGEIIIALDVIK